MAYLTFEQWRDRSVARKAEADALYASVPEFFTARLQFHTTWIDGRLRKRYAAPFDAPVPDIVLGWLEALFTLDFYLRRGFNPESKQDAIIEERAKTAKAEILEAADSETGLFDLPLRQDTTTTGIVKGGPLGSSEESPYAWTDQQVRVARNG